MSYKPLSLLLEEADALLDVLSKQFQVSQGELKHIMQLSRLLSKHFSIFSNQLEDVTNKFLDESRIEESTHLKPYFLGLRKILAGVTDLLTRISKDINEVVTVPVELFGPGFTSIFEDVKSKALHLKEEVKGSSQHLQKTDKPTNFLGYNGLLMTRKRSTQFDLSEYQKKYSSLIKELDILYSNKYKTLRSAYKHLGNILNEIPNLEETELSSESSQSSYVQPPSPRLPSQSISQSIVEQVKAECDSVRLLKLVPLDPKLQHYCPSQLLQYRIQKQVENLLNPSSQHSDPNIKSLILQDINNIELFLDALNCQVKSEVILTPGKYYELATMMKYILRLVLTEREEKEDLLHSILSITLRIHCQGRILIRELARDEDYWVKEESWEAMLEYFKKEISKSKQRQPEVSPVKSDTSAKSTGLFSRSLKKFWPMTSSPESSKQQETNATSLEILKQINYFIIKLQLPNEFAIKVIANLCQKEKIPQGELQKLLRQQKLDKKQNLNQKYLSSLNTKLRREKKFFQPQFNILIHSLKHTLPFLPLEDLLSLLFVNKTFHRTLSQPIYRRILLFQSPKTISKYRKNLYKLILKSNKHSKQQYQQLVKQLPKEIKVSQVINHDVKRCLKWAPQHQPQLYEILVTYSFHHPQVRYIQGMHCLCERLFHLETNPHQIYSMFETLISLFFNDILRLNFEKLRLRMYQFTRILELNYPKLSQHFFKQKLQAQHYLIPWVLTLWGDKQGQLADLLWDGFIVSGWKWWIKVCVWLIGLHEKQYLLFNFDSILKHINNEIERDVLNKKLSELSSLVSNSLKLAEDIDKIKVTDSLLKDIQLEFDYSDYKLTPFLNLPTNN